MTFWKMQLHPNDESSQSCFYAFEILADRLIGLDFAEDEGDLRLTTKDLLRESNHKFYYAFCDEMAVDDLVMIVSHNYPFALCRVASTYHYVSDPEILGHWFRHFRYVDVLGLYRDYELNPLKWQLVRTPNAISPMRTKTSSEFKLMTAWAAEFAEEVE